MNMMYSFVFCIPVSILAGSNQPKVVVEITLKVTLCRQQRSKKVRSNLIPQQSNEQRMFEATLFLKEGP